MTQTSHILTTLLCLTIILPLAGCGKATGVPGLVKCEGTVQWNGSPVEEARITFHSNNPNGRGGFAVSDAKGKFKATTLHTNDGIEPGDYIVTVTKTSSVQEKEEIPMERVQENFDPDANRSGRGGVGPARYADVHQIPEAYSDKTTSGLTVVVPTGGTKDLLLELVGEISNKPPRFQPR